MKTLAWFCCTAGLLIACDGGGGDVGGVPVDAAVDAQRPNDSVHDVWLSCEPGEYWDCGDGWCGPGCTGIQACGDGSSMGPCICLCDAYGEECTDGTADCEENAECANTAGSDDCNCKAGYDWNDDNTACVDVDECAEGTDDCDTNALCANYGGSYDCACFPGYEGDGTVCVDKNECLADPSPCDANATCENTAGSYDCNCNSGFADDPDSDACIPVP